MNLSHVERYFADILSAIESGQEIALHSATEPLGAFENDPLPVSAKIRLPENLFIIGTVNIDETTYMFSPKVLDRANVIEFRVSADEISSFLEAPAKVDMDALAGKGAGYGSAFVNAARAEVSLAQLPAEIGDGTAAAAELKQRLTELFIELAPIGAEFGFRTAFEVSRFFYHHAVLTGEGWQFKDALDAQIVQKLMPKLHGSDRKLRKVLDKLQTFCETHDLQLSRAKTERMLERLTQDGFTSFAEA
jgi:5-methylcytosine-specific restriction endonuclease McrBC GTP-binding regulatory subunit McrB